MITPYVAAIRAAVLVSAAASGTAAAIEPTAHARAPSPLAQSCMGCHQSKVNSPSMPALDALSPAAIAASLRRSRDAPQFGSIMARFTSKLTDADIDDLARQLGAAKTRP
jgi:cytochrome c553